MMENSGNIVIEMSHLKKSFGSNHVLTDFSLSLTKGENMAILGKSGSGKSVLIKCIVGLLKYDGGSLKVFGNEINQLQQRELDSLRARIGFVFQSSALYDSMTVRQNLEFSLRRHGKDKTKEEIRTLVEEILTNVSLPHAIDMMPAELSGGMKKRIGLARALILRPEIILYDEPTTGLDPITAKEISNLMNEIKQQYNTSSLIITHDMQCARLTADRITLLADGINYASGTYDEMSRMTDEKVRSFFSDTSTGQVL